jgi:hypothetical protein
MTKTTLALAIALAMPNLAHAQGYYAPNNQSIYGGASGGYQWRDTAPSYNPYSYTTPAPNYTPRGYTCVQAGNTTFCN